MEVRVPSLPLIGASVTLTFVAERLKLLEVSVKLIVPLRTLTLSMFQLQLFQVRIDLFNVDDLVGFAYFILKSDVFHLDGAF